MEGSRRTAMPAPARGFRMTRTRPSGMRATLQPFGFSMELVIVGSMTDPRTIAQAVEDAAKCDPTRGFRFVPEEGLSEGTSEATFSFIAIERASARYGGALQALGLNKGDRVALILPASEDFILCFFGAIRAGLIPTPIYPPLGL